MQARQNRKDSTRTDVVGYQRTFRRERSGAAVEACPHVRQISEAKVGMHGESRSELLAERQTPLIADDAVARPAIAIAGGENEAKSRRERRLQLTLFQSLVSVIEQDVADTVDSVSTVNKMIGWNRVRKLMILGKYRPLLREIKRPPSGTRIIVVNCGKDMLHYARFLVVGLFDQKTIIFDHIDRSFFRGAQCDPHERYGAE